MASSLSDTEGDFAELVVHEDTTIGNQMEGFFPLPMVTAQKTEMYVKFAKVMIIFQGPNEDEKNQSVKQLIEKFKHSCCVCSDETYKKLTKAPSFDLKKIKEFYTFCRNEAKDACELGINLIVINQSRTTKDEVKYFLYLAQKSKYIILIYPPIVTEIAAGDITVGKGFHRSRSSLESCNLAYHLFCGWFLNDIDSVELREEAGLYFGDCCLIPEFKTFFEKIDPSCDYRSSYGLKDKQQDVAYCVAKIFYSVTSAFHYFKKPPLCKNYGKMTTLYIVGFVISPCTIAARVKLTFHQKDLWELADVIKNEADAKQYPSKLLKMSKVNIPNETVATISTKCKRSLQDSGQKIYEPFQNVVGKGRTAHIVLGKTKEASDFDVDYDVATAVNRETVASKTKADVIIYDTDKALVKRFGKYWIVYLKESLAVDAMFGSCCLVK